MKAMNLVAAAAICALSAVALAEDRPYTNGPVTQITYVRVKDGHFDDYMRHLGGLYRKQMEALKTAGLVLDYKVLAPAPRTPSDANVILTVVYPNMGVFDKAKEFDDVGAKVAGTFSEQNKAFADRGVMRDIIGSELAREMVLR